MEDRKLVTWEAGPIVRQVLMPLRESKDAPVLRASRSKPTASEQQTANFKRSWKQLEMRIAANFQEKHATVGCVTFDKAHRPRDRTQAQSCFYYYRGPKKLGGEREAQGLPPLKMVWGVEVLSSRSGLWHVHFVTDETDFERLRRCWGYGSVMEFEPLRVDPEAGFQKLAQYISKEPREVQDFKSRAGLHGWSATRNCVKPRFDVLRVPGDFVLAAPDGCRVFLDDTRGGEFGEIREIEFMRRG